MIFERFGAQMSHFGSRRGPENGEIWEPKPGSGGAKRWQKSVKSWVNGVMVRVVVLKTCGIAVFTCVSMSNDVGTRVSTGFPWVFGRNEAI